MEHTKKKSLREKFSFLLLTAAMLMSLCVGCATDYMDIPAETPDTIVDSAVEPNIQVEDQTLADHSGTASTSFNYEDIPPYTTEAYVVVNNNKPFFTEDDMTTTSFETYSELDELGRVGVAYACIGQDLMPTQERGNISQVKPTGWKGNNKPYDFVDGRYIYNRCHIIGWQLTGEDANWKNLATGTRYLNIEGNLPAENMVADYIKETNNHVLYRVTPIFVGDELVCRGELMEGYSVEDDGEGICYNIFCYNVQPGVEIDYATGKNWATGEQPPEGVKAPTEPVGKTETDITTQSDEATEAGEMKSYVINTNTMKFHDPDCGSAQDITPENRTEFYGFRADLIAKGFKPCGRCKP